jgi:hypothetical protein
MAAFKKLRSTSAAEPTEPYETPSICTLILLPGGNFNNPNKYDILEHMEMILENFLFSLSE